MKKIDYTNRIILYVMEISKTAYTVYTTLEEDGVRLKILEHDENINEILGSYPTKEEAEEAIECIKRED